MEDQTTSATPDSALQLIDLPAEVLKNILEYLTNQDLRALSRVCTRWYGLIAETHFHTLYARSLRLLSLQYKHLAELEKEFSKYEKSLNVSILTPSRLSSDGRWEYFKIFLAIGLAAHTYISSRTLIPTNLYVFGILSMMMLSLAIFILNWNESRELLDQRLDQKSLQDLTRLRDQLEKKLPNVNQLSALLITHLAVPQTFRDSLTQFGNLITAFKAFITELELFSQSVRLRNIHEIDKTKFSPATQDYLKTAVKFWNNSKPEDRITIADEIDSPVSEEAGQYPM